MDDGTSDTTECDDCERKVPWLATWHWLIVRSDDGSHLCYCEQCKWKHRHEQ